MGWAKDLSSMNSEADENAVSGLDLTEATAKERAAMFDNSNTPNVTGTAKYKDDGSPARAGPPEGQAAGVPVELPVEASKTTAPSAQRPQSLYDPLPPGCLAQFPAEAIIVSLATQIERHFGFKVDRLLQESAVSSSPEAQATLLVEPPSALKPSSLSNRQSRLRPRIKCSFSGVVSPSSPSSFAGDSSSVALSSAKTAVASDTEPVSAQRTEDGTLHNSNASSSSGGNNTTASSTFADSSATAPRSCRIYVVVHAGPRAGNFLKLKNSYPLDSYTKQQSSTKGNGNGSAPTSRVAENNSGGSPSGSEKAAAAFKLGDEVALELPSWSAVLSWSDTPCTSNIDPRYVDRGLSHGSDSAAAVDTAAKDSVGPAVEAGFRFWLAVLDVAPATAVHFGAVEVVEFESANEGSDLNSESLFDGESGDSSGTESSSADKIVSSSEVLRSLGTEQAQLVPSVNKFEEHSSASHSSGDVPLPVEAAAALDTASDYPDVVTKLDQDSKENTLVEGTLASAADAALVMDDGNEEAPVELVATAAATTPVSRTETASVLRRVTVERGKDRRSHPTYDVVVTTVEAGESRQSGDKADKSSHEREPTVKCVQRRRRGLRFQVFRELNQTLESAAAASTADKNNLKQRHSDDGKTLSSSPLHQERSKSMSLQVDLISSMKGLFEEKINSAADQQAATRDDLHLTSHSQQAEEDQSDTSAISVAPIEFPKNFLKSVFGVQLTRAEIEERRRCLDEWLGSIEAHAASFSSAESEIYEAFLTGVDGT